MTLLSEYLAELAKRVEREKDSLARGSAKTFDEYARSVGIIVGLRVAEQLLVDLAKQKPAEERM